jgi:tRNA A-37 threonylcarbamoyl transferase component Bud32
VPRSIMALRMDWEDDKTPPPLARDPDDSLVGMWLLDQYRLLSLLGRGGMAQVYLAEQPAVGRLAAIKIVRPATATESDWQQRFRQEARTASRLQHPNIVVIYNFGEMADGALYLAMEYLKGPTLKAVLQRGPLPALKAVTIACDCAAALDHAHGRGVVHRDFKPDNVMLVEDAGREVAKVLDFGLARMTEPSDRRKTTTLPGAIVGTPCYMSPEQCGGEVATPHSDQYALGVVLHEMLTGELPIAADSPLEFLHAHQFVMPNPPSAACGTDECRLLDPIVMRMLTKAPGERFATTAEVLAQLTAVLERLRRQSRADTTASRGQEALAPVVPIWQLGADALGQQTRAELRTRGFEVTDASTMHRPALWVVGLPGRRWQELGRAVTADCAPERTLTCIDAGLDDEGLVGLAERFRHLFIGSFPLLPIPVSLALSWLHGRGGGIDALLPHSSVRVFQLTSSTQKHAAVQALGDDARLKGIRGQAAQSLVELAEEMILNAIFHAPVEPDGTHRYAGVDPGAPLTLRRGEEVLLSWAFLEHHVAVSVRDQFGSLEPRVILGRVTGKGRAPELAAARAGSGMGLRIMSRAASHLCLALCPGMWCEVIALVPHQSSGAARRSLSVLQDLGRVVIRLGDRLQLFEVTESASTRLELRGEINETCDLQSIFQRSGKVTLDLAGVLRINSIGIRAWLEASRARSPALDLALERCSLAIVNQLNMIPAMLEDMRVASFYAPYICERCDLAVMELLRTSELPRQLPPQPQCGQCGAALTFDGLVDEYFCFLR